MKRIYDEDILSIIGVTLVLITSVVIILTFLSTYYFINMPLFDTYLPLQICISITMLVLGVRFYIYKNDINKYIYSNICFFIAIISLLFALNLIT